MILEKIRSISEHSGAVYDICSDDQYLYSCSADKVVTRWSIKTGEQDSFTIKASNPVYSIAIDKSSKLLWMGLSNGDIHVIDLAKKEEVKFFQQHKKGVFSICVLPNKGFICASDADGNLSVWNADTLKLSLLLPFDSGKIRHLSCSQDENLLILNCQDDKIRILETTGFNEIVTLEGHNKGTNCSVIRNSDESLISGGQDGHIRVWDWKKEKETQAIPAHNYGVYDLYEDESNELLISASIDKSIKVWNLNTLEFIEKVEFKTGGHKHSVNRLCPLPENQFASCSDDRQIIFWNTLSR